METNVERLVRWVTEAPQSRIPILVALIALSGVVLGSFLTAIVWPLIKSVLTLVYGWLDGKLLTRRFEQRYLDWVTAEHEFLPLLPTTLVPVTDKHIQPLDGLYVSLIATDGSNIKTSLEELGCLLDRTPRLIILGEPGAGKTTTLRFLALTFAQARTRRPLLALTNKQRNTARNTSRARQRLKTFYKDLPPTGIFQSIPIANKRRPLPVFVYLNRLPETRTWPNDFSFLDALREDWKSIDSLRDFPPRFFEKKIRRGECIFLLDAFDELGSTSQREFIALRIGELASTDRYGNKFIASSRIVGYEGQLAKSGFSTLLIEPLTWSLIKQLVTQWYQTIGASELTPQLLAHLKTNPRVVELAVNPMLLSLIVLVQYVRRLIPDRRHVLYAECLNILVERRYAPPKVQEFYDSILPSGDAIAMLKQIAFHFHYDRTREITRKQLTNVVRRIANDMPKSVAVTRTPDEIIKNIEERSHLLVERGLNDSGEPLIAFSHLTFQEYLTSSALQDSIARRGEAAVSLDLLSCFKTDPVWWEEVALLYAAQLDVMNREGFFSRLYRARSDD